MLNFQNIHWHHILIGNMQQFYCILKRWAKSEAGRNFAPIAQSVYINATSCGRPSRSLLRSVSCNNIEFCRRYSGSMRKVSFIKKRFQSLVYHISDALRTIKVYQTQIKNTFCLQKHYFIFQITLYRIQMYLVFCSSALTLAILILISLIQYNLYIYLWLGTLWLHRL